MKIKIIQTLDIYFLQIIPKSVQQKKSYFQGHISVLVNGSIFNTNSEIEKITKKIF